MAQDVVITQQPFYVNQPKERILEALYDYYLMDPEQITRRAYNTLGSLSKVRNHLTALYRNGYIDRTAISNHSLHGSDHAVYRLTGQGLAYLDGLDYDVSKRTPRKAEIPQGDGYVRHTLAVNDFLLSAELLARQTPEFSIVRMIHEQTLKRSKFTPKKRVGVNRPVPDAFLHVRYGEQEMPIWLEVDRGSEHLSNFKKKVEAIVTWLKSGAYEEEYGEKNCTVAVYTTVGMERQAELLHWIEQVLDEQRARDYGQVFLTANRTDLSPTDLFLAPFWIPAFGDKPESLIPTDL